MLLQENKPLAGFTTLGVGGPARWFVKVSSEDEIAEAAAWARAQSVPLFILGGGSNLLISDAGFDGLVLHLALRGISILENGEIFDSVKYEVAAGEDWDAFVETTVQNNCAGIECLAGIPGTVGGTPVQNVGAYGQEVATSITKVRAYDLHAEAYVELAAADCQFAYRRSRFNSVDRGRYVVTRVDYALIRSGAPTLRYADLQRAFPAGTQPSLADVSSAVRSVRKSKGMLLVEGDPDCRSAGSFFKNPVVSEEQFERIAANSTMQPPRFPAGSGTENAGRVKVPAAWLIEQAGFAKGYVLGSAGVSSRHTLALVNLGSGRGGGSANEILALANKIKTAVAEQFGIDLEMEPVMLGF